MKLNVSFSGGARVTVELRAEMTDTVRALVGSLPFESSANRWGDEVYFETPAAAELETDARELMAVGDVAFWPDGNAMAMFFGRTPVSTDERPRAYSRCNIVGRVSGDPLALASVMSGEKVEVSALT